MSLDGRFIFRYRCINFCRPQSELLHITTIWIVKVLMAGLGMNSDKHGLAMHIGSHLIYRYIFFLHTHTYIYIYIYIFQYAKKVCFTVFNLHVLSTTQYVYFFGLLILFLTSLYSVKILSCLLHIIVKQRCQFHLVLSFHIAPHQMRYSARYSFKNY